MFAVRPPLPVTSGTIDVTVYWEPASSGACTSIFSIGPPSPAVVSLVGTLAARTESGASIVESTGPTAVIVATTSLRPGPLTSSRSLVSAAMASPSGTSWTPPPRATQLMPSNSSNVSARQYWSGSLVVVVNSGSFEECQTPLILAVGPKAPPKFPVEPAIPPTNRLIVSVTFMSGSLTFRQTPASGAELAVAARKIAPSSVMVTKAAPPRRKSAETFSALPMWRRCQPTDCSTMLSRTSSSIDASVNTMR